MRCVSRNLTLLTLLAFLLTGIGPLFAQDDDRIGWITLEKKLRERPHPLTWLTGEEPTATLAGVIAMIDDAARRDDIPSLVIHLKDLKANLAQILTIGSAIDRAQAAGKTVHVFADIYGPGELLLAASADEIIIQPGGYVSFPGLYSEEIYLGDTLRLIGLEPDFIQIGDYKGAAEPIARSAPSDEWSANVEALIDDLWGQMTKRLREGRRMNAMQFERALDRGWAADSAEAIELGLVDAAVDILDLRAHLAVQAGTQRITQRLGPAGEKPAIDPNNPFAVLQVLMRKPEHEPTRETIAVVHIDGPIVDGESGGGLFGGATVGSRTIRSALQKIEENDQFKGLVVRIDSPGGSAIASEMMWQGIRRVAERKPVYISVGGMAASGGYYVAVGGQRIHVEPVSIVGSIGVVGGKIVLGGLFDKIKVGVTPRARGPHAELMSSARPWTERERTLIRGEMLKIYDLFAQRVADGRGPRVEMSRIAEGRLFTGRQAVENGMADEIADLGQTVRSLAAATGLAEGAYDVMHYPGPRALTDMFEEMFGFADLRSAATALAGPQDSPSPIAGVLPTVAALEAIFSDGWPQVRDSLNGLMMLRDERVILLSPRTLILR